MPPPLVRSLLKHADRIAWHSFGALLFIAAGVAIDAVMCNFERVVRPLANTHTYLGGPFGTLMISRLPCGVHNLLASPNPIDLAAARASDACFTPSPQASIVEGEDAFPNDLFSTNADLCIIAATASGWPMCCLEGFRIVQITNNPVASTTTDVSLLAFTDPFGVNPGWAIPTHPRWFPLGVNFAVGIGVSILVSSYVQSRRRSRRARQGLCPTCAYNRASLAPGAPCPECGAASPA